MSLLVKQREDRQRMEWYSDQLLKMATDLADRLLPAFNSTSGVPYSRVFFFPLIILNLFLFIGKFKERTFAQFKTST